MITDAEALDMLRARGHATGTPDVHTGTVRVWLRGSDDAIDVRLGRELHELAQDRLTFEDIAARRDDETVRRAE
jgi:hypothetical protein